MKNILVLVQDYSDNSGSVALMYVHVRNKYYAKHNINVTVQLILARYKLARRSDNL